MKKVEFEKVEAELGKLDLYGQKYYFDKAEKVIKKRIEEGWEYKGYIPYAMRKDAVVKVISLIFEKEE